MIPRLDHIMCRILGSSNCQSSGAEEGRFDRGMPSNISLHFRVTSMAGQGPSRQNRRADCRDCAWRVARSWWFQRVCVCVRVRARVRGGVRACGRWMDQSCDKKGNILPYMYVYTYMYTHTPMASDILNRCAWYLAGSQEFLPKNFHYIDAGRCPVQDPAGHLACGGHKMFRIKRCFEGFKRC